MSLQEARVYQRCRRCRTRWPQGPCYSGLCCQCFYAIEKELAAWNAMAAEDQARARENIPVEPPPHREITVDGRTFEVVFDGS
jgi:hypothetical protein